MPGGSIRDIPFLVHCVGAIVIFRCIEMSLFHAEMFSPGAACSSLPCCFRVPCRRTPGRIGKRSGRVLPCEMYVLGRHGRHCGEEVSKCPRLCRSFDVRRASARAAQRRPWRLDGKPPKSRSVAGWDTNSQGEGCTTPDFPALPADRFRAGRVSSDVPCTMHCGTYSRKRRQRYRRRNAPDGSDEDVLDTDECPTRRRCLAV